MKNIEKAAVFLGRNQLFLTRAEKKWNRKLRSRGLCTVLKSVRYDFLSITGLDFHLIHIQTHSYRTNRVTDITLHIWILFPLIFRIHKSKTFETKASPLAEMPTYIGDINGIPLAYLQWNESLWKCLCTKILQYDINIYKLNNSFGMLYNDSNFVWNIFSEDTQISFIEKHGTWHRTAL